MKKHSMRGTSLSAANMFQSWDWGGDEFRLDVDYEKGVFKSKYPGGGEWVPLDLDQATALRDWLDRRLGELAKGVKS